MCTNANPSPCELCITHPITGLLLQLGHGGCTSTTSGLVRRHNTALHAESLVQRPDWYSHDDCAAVWVGDDALLAVLHLLAVHLTTPTNRAAKQTKTNQHVTLRSKKAVLLGLAWHAQGLNSTRAGITTLGAIAALLTSGTTSGVSASIRKADELSTTTQPALVAADANFLLWLPPALKSAMSTPLKLSSVSSSTVYSLPAYSSFLPLERALANNFNCQTKMSRSRIIES